MLAESRRLRKEDVFVKHAESKCVQEHAPSEAEACAKAGVCGKQVLTSAYRMQALPASKCLRKASLLKEQVHVLAESTCLRRAGSLGSEYFRKTATCGKHMLAENRCMLHSESKCLRKADARAQQWRAKSMCILIVGACAKQVLAQSRRLRKA